jgi:dephospho-CoA kinase
VVVDSDVLAREVVGVGTPGLAAVRGRFGIGILAADGSLDRAALASIVFADPVARRQLEAITHPLVRSRAAELRAAAPPGSVVVNDIPLLTTRTAAAAFHLVIGVGAPEDVRLRRLVARGLTARDAAARIAAQIDDGARRLLCDIWIDNGAGPAEVRRRTDLVWSRLAEYAANVEARRPAGRGAPVLVPYNPEWPAIADRVMARVHHALDGCRIDHIGPTAVEGLPANDVIDLQLTVADLSEAESFAPLLAEAGLPLREGFTQDTPPPAREGDGGPAEPVVTDRNPRDVDEHRWRKTLHGNADPGQGVNLHLRVRDWPNWVWALRFRDWLRADDSGKADYRALKEMPTAAHGGDPTVAGYAEAKEEFLASADARSRAWAAVTGWQPD